VLIVVSDHVTAWTEMLCNRRNMCMLWQWAVFEKHEETRWVSVSFYSVHSFRGVCSCNAHVFLFIVNSQEVNNLIRYEILCMLLKSKWSFLIMNYYGWNWNASYWNSYVCVCVCLYYVIVLYQRRDCSKSCLIQFCD
jgi:hypothetical protein